MDTQYTSEFESFGMVTPEERAMMVRILKDMRREVEQGVCIVIHIESGHGQSDRETWGPA